MLELIKSYLKKNAPTFGIIGSVGGFIADVLAPLANFALYLLLASVGALIAMLLYSYIANKDKKITKDERILTRVVFLVCFIVIWGILSLVHVFGPPQGVLAASVPAIEDLQASIGIIQQDVADIKSDTEQILLELQDIKGDLEAAQNGTITSNPDSAEEWYTNAILFASQGDNEKSIEAYEEFFAYGYPYIDAYQNFNLIAKNELSKKELASFYDDLAKNQPNNIVAQLMVGALIKDTSDRRSYYDEFRDKNGDSAVLLYWLINEYSAVGTYVYANELSAEEKQQWTSSDQAELKELTEAYAALPITDSLELYFINSFSYDGAKTLINSLSNQFEDETYSNMLENPLVLVINPTGNENESTITFIIYDAYTDILYRIPGVVDEFTSTIPEESTSNSPWGSTSSPETSVNVSISPGKHDIEIYWLDKNEKPSETYFFNDVDFLNFEDWSALPEKTNWVYPDTSN